MATQKTQRKRRHHARRAEHPILWRLERWLVPHSQNNYRPQLIGRYGIGAIVLLFMAVQVFGMSTGTAVLGQQAPMTPGELLELTNIEREKESVSALTLNTQLTKAASMKAKDMLDHNYWSHTSPDGVTPWHWLQKADYSYAYAGENLARNFNSSSSVTAAWMASPGHRDNLLHAYYTEVGFAVMDGQMNGSPVRLVVALYGTPSSSLTEVAGIQTMAPPMASLGFFAKIGVSIQSLSPGMLGVSVLLLAGLLVAFATMVVTGVGQRKQGGGFWRRHHASVKVIGMSVFLSIILVAQSAGQIG